MALHFNRKERYHHPASGAELSIVRVFLGGGWEIIWQFWRKYAEIVAECGGMGFGTLIAFWRTDCCG